MSGRSGSELTRLGRQSFHNQHITPGRDPIASTKFGILIRSSVSLQLKLREFPFSDRDHGAVIFHVLEWHKLANSSR